MESLYNLDYDYIFVDEISMVKEIFYKFLIMLKTMKPTIKFIIVGDFKQLPPINDRIDIFENDFDYGDSMALKELCSFNKLELSHCRRADDKFFKICSDINNINKSIFKSNFTDRHLAFTNKKRIEINDICMEKYNNIYMKEHNDICVKNHKKKDYYFITIDKNIHDPNSQEIIVYPKLPIISKKNNKSIDIVNNEQFIVTKVEQNKITIKNVERELVVTSDEFQKTFYCAYCITVHSSQGATFDFPYTIHEFDRYSKKMKYVSLTRSSSLDFVNII